MLRYYISIHIEQLQHRINLLNKKIKPSGSAEFRADFRELKTLCDERDQLKRILMRVDESQEYETDTKWLRDNADSVKNDMEKTEAWYKALKKKETK